MWACLFFSLLSANIGFALGCFFRGLKITPQEEKPRKEKKTAQSTKAALSQKEKNYRDDIKFLMNFDGNTKKDEEN